MAQQITRTHTSPGWVFAPIALPAEIVAVLSRPDALAERDEHGQLVSVEATAPLQAAYSRDGAFAGARAEQIRVTGKQILAALDASVADAFECQESKRLRRYRRNSLYSIDLAAGFAVVLERDGTWDSKKNFGTELKEYILVEMRTGLRRVVGSAAVRGDVRTAPTSPAAGVVGAIAFAKGCTKAAARRLLRDANRRPVFLTPAELAAEAAEAAARSAALRAIPRQTPFWLRDPDRTKAAPVLADHEAARASRREVERQQAQRVLAELGVA